MIHDFNAYNYTRIILCITRAIMDIPKTNIQIPERLCILGLDLEIIFFIIQVCLAGVEPGTHDVSDRDHKWKKVIKDSLFQEWRNHRHNYLLHNILVAIFPFE